MEQKSVFELTPVHDSRKSFYSKAHVERIVKIIGGCVVGYDSLFSYGTRVAVAIYACYHGEEYLHIYRTWGGQSRTTQRHIAEWLTQNGWQKFHGVRIDKKRGWDMVPFMSEDELRLMIDYEPTRVGIRFRKEQEQGHEYLRRSV